MGLFLLGFEKLGNQGIDFSLNVKNAEQLIEQVQLQQDIMAIGYLLGSDRGNQGLSSLIIEPREVDPTSSNALFETSESEKVLDQIKRLSEVINFINIPTTISTAHDQALGS